MTRSCACGRTIDFWQEDMYPACNSCLGDYESVVKGEYPGGMEAYRAKRKAMREERKARKAIEGKRCVRLHRLLNQRD